ncbi:MAG: DUF2278 family protein, partial [Bacteroidetes bacterium]|nr:DUF2278 family protein [Bacteroidota bacterium]
MANQGVNYGLLRGKIVNDLPYQHGTDHFQIEVNGAGKMYRIAIDVYSQFAATSTATHFRHGKNNQPLETDRMVMFLIDTNYNHEITAKMLEAGQGFTPKSDLPDELHLDYLRYDPPLVDVSKMEVLPPKDQNGQHLDLNDDISPWVEKAKNDNTAEVFAFGSGWDDNAPGAQPDHNHYFDPEPTLGIHDIHMNQGDTGKEQKYNSIWQDGALFIHFTNPEKWVAMFFHF